MPDPLGLQPLCLSIIAIARQIITFILNYRDLRERFRTLRLSLIRVQRTTSFVKNNWDGNGRKFGTSREKARILALLSTALSSEQQAERLLQQARSRVRRAWMAIFMPDGLAALEQDLKGVERGLNPMIRAMRDRVGTENHVRARKKLRNRRISYFTYGSIGLLTLAGSVTLPFALGACVVTKAAEVVYNTKYGPLERENAPDQDNSEADEHEDTRCEWEQADRHTRASSLWRQIPGPAARHRSHSRAPGQEQFSYRPNTARTRA